MLKLTSEQGANPRIAVPAATSLCGDFPVSTGGKVPNARLDTVYRELEKELSLY